MMKCIRNHVANEKGNTLVFVAVSLATLLAMGALAVDLGMLFTARGEAQRTADAAAHGGVIEFWKETEDPASAVYLARDSALFLASSNTVRNTAVGTAIISEQWFGDTLRTEFTEGVVDVIPKEQKVRVTVRRGEIPTWFARMFGVETAAVAARSAAQVRYANTATCVKPFAVADLWDNRNGDGVVNLSTGEYYKRVGDLAKEPIGKPETGYGSDLRNNDGQGITKDYGRQVLLRVGNQGGTTSPSMYFSWDLPGDETLAQKQCPGGTSGQSTYRKNICLCNKNAIKLGETYYTNTGATVGDTKFGLDDLIKQDPTASWDAAKREVVNSDPKYGHWTNSPRVVIVPLMDPQQLLTEGNLKSGKQPIVFNNFASVFIEARPPGQGNQDDIYGRFLPFARGSGTAAGSEMNGTLVRTLQIVE